MSKAINLLGVRGIADGKNWEYLSSYFLSGGTKLGAGNLLRTYLTCAKNVIENNIN